jgi:phytoene dehydrogenase-like protein
MGVDVAIVGGGVSGLTCARTLQQEGFSTVVLEAQDRVGGRVGTDVVDGFRLDHGFQVLLTAYPESQRLLDYAALDLRAIHPGADIFLDGKFHRISDPWRHPVEGAMGLLTPVGSVADKLKVAKLRSSVLSGDIDDLFRRPEMTTAVALRGCGFSDRMIESFFRPFYGGIFLERNLETSARFFEFTFRMFACGDTAVPAKGMQAIPDQLAAGIDVRTGQRVTAIAKGKVTLASGETIEADRVVIATSGLDDRLPYPRRAAWNGSVCLYFAAAEPPRTGPVLMLNGTGSGLVNNAIVLSEVSREYAPPGQSLVSVTVIGAPKQNDTELTQSVRAELHNWFGNPVKSWRHLRNYSIPRSLPAYPPGLQAESFRQLEPWLYACGDALSMPSLNFAMQSGRETAEAIAR